MRISNRSITSLAIFLIGSLNFLHSQQATSPSMPAMPSMPNMTVISEGLSMPHISAPTIGNKFYTPGTTQSTSKIQNSDTQKETTSDVSTISSPQILSALSNAFSGDKPAYLTASDIATLGNNGSFNSIYSLLESGSSLNSSFSQASTTELMLQNIMTELNELKGQSERNTQTLASFKEKSINQVETQNRPAILRFVVNGYNLLETCKTVYFSEKERDGSFLLTGDRKYTSDNKSRDETFYLLFKADGNCGTLAGYDVEPKVVQDYKNEYSFLYQLAQKHSLKAEKTGNLVSVRCTEPTWNMDLLLDIGNK